MRQRFFFILCFWAVFVSCACAARHPAENLPELQRDYLARAHTFRHIVRIEFPHSDMAPLSFDGVLRYEPPAPHAGAQPSVRVVCLGALGLTMCDMTVSPQGYVTNSMHPSLARLPRIESHIARCVSAVWFASLPMEIPAGGGVMREMYKGVLVEHSRSGDDQKITRALGPKVFWTVRHTPALPQPREITFESQRPEYSVRIRFAGEMHNEVTAP